MHSPLGRDAPTSVFVVLERSPTRAFKRGQEYERKLAKIPEVLFSLQALIVNHYTESNNFYPYLLSQRGDGYLLFLLH
jgi:hypothetical protein